MWDFWPLNTDQAKRITSKRLFNLSGIWASHWQIPSGWRNKNSSAALKGLYDPCEFELAVRQE
jgi:hypothetical protein